MRRNKYGVAPKACRTSRDGTVFDSKGEMIRWETLRQHVMAKAIRNLRRQVKFPLVINGVKVGDYTADFVYERGVPVKRGDAPMFVHWEEVIEDFKGVLTKDAAFRIKVFEALYQKKVLITRGK